MRALRKPNKEQEEEESVFVPMTDMTVSFLFIVMILLAFFAIQFSDEDSVARSIYEKSVAERKEIQEQLANLRLENERLDNKNTQLQRETETLREDLKQLAKENTRLKYQLAELEKQFKVSNPVEAYIARSQARRLQILEMIEQQLKLNFPDILVEISPENDALRFKGDGLFSSGSSYLAPSKREIISTIGELLEETLACYTVNKKEIDYQQCNPTGAVVEAAQIEGHTDSDGSDSANMNLSAQRAISALITMIGDSPGLSELRNIKGQPVISVAGYGKMRPVASNDSIQGKAENRRIDLRLIMYTPGSRDQVEKIQTDIENGLGLLLERGVE